MSGPVPDEVANPPPEPPPAGGQPADTPAEDPTAMQAAVAADAATRPGRVRSRHNATVHQELQEWLAHDLAQAAETFLTQYRHGPEADAAGIAAYREHVDGLVYVLNGFPCPDNASPQTVRSYNALVNFVAEKIPEGASRAGAMLLSPAEQALIGFVVDFTSVEETSNGSVASALKSDTSIAAMQDMYKQQADAVTALRGGKTKAVERELLRMLDHAESRKESFTKGTTLFFHYDSAKAEFGPIMEEVAAYVASQAPQLIQVEDGAITAASRAEYNRFIDDLVLTFHKQPILPEPAEGSARAERIELAEAMFRHHGAHFDPQHVYFNEMARIIGKPAQERDGTLRVGANGQIFCESLLKTDEFATLAARCQQERATNPGGWPQPAHQSTRPVPLPEYSGKLVFNEAMQPLKDTIQAEQWLMFYERGSPAAFSWLVNPITKSPDAIAPFIAGLTVALCDGMDRLHDALREQKLHVHAAAATKHADAQDASATPPVKPFNIARPLLTGFHAQAMEDSRPHHINREQSGKIFMLTEGKDEAGRPRMQEITPDAAQDSVYADIKRGVRNGCTQAVLRPNAAYGVTRLGGMVRETEQFVNFVSGGSTSGSKSVLRSSEGLEESSLHVAHTQAELQDHSRKKCVMLGLAIANETSGNAYATFQDIDRANSTNPEEYADPNIFSCAKGGTTLLLDLMTDGFTEDGRRIVSNPESVGGMVHTITQSVGTIVCDVILRDLARELTSDNVLLAVPQEPEQDPLATKISLSANAIALDRQQHTYASFDADGAAVTTQTRPMYAEDVQRIFTAMDNRMLKVNSVAMSRSDDRFRELAQAPSVHGGETELLFPKCTTLTNRMVDPVPLLHGSQNARTMRSSPSETVISSPDTWENRTGVMNIDSGKYWNNVAHGFRESIDGVLRWMGVERGQRFFAEATGIEIVTPVKATPAPPPSGLSALRKEVDGLLKGVMLQLHSRGDRPAVSTG